MACNIRRIMRQRSQSERVLVGVLALRQQLAHEITAANVVHQVAEFHAAKRIVAEVLDHGAAISVGVRFRELVLGKGWKPLQQKRVELIGPHQIHDFLVSEHRVSEGMCVA